MPKTIGSPHGPLHRNNPRPHGLQWLVPQYQDVRFPLLPPPHRVGKRAEPFLPLLRILMIKQFE
jgi:hypothetical protein